MKNDWFLWLCSFALISLVLGLGFSKKNLYAETNTVSSTVVNNTPPTANSPAINIVNSDICKSGVSGAIQSNVIGFSTGVTITDMNCERIKLARSLYSMGMKVAGVSILCQDARVFDAMYFSGTSCPYIGGKIGQDAVDGWMSEEGQKLIPEGSVVKAQFQKTQTVNEPTKEGDWDAIKDFGLIALSMLLIL
tara:strand:+ start:3780 stop:4355 length:576 start_codon:yes stop_codon:yes gene_type:complete